MPNTLSKGQVNVGALSIAGTTLTGTEFAALDGVTAGTQAAGKAVIANSDVNTGISKVTQLHIGATGAETQVTATAAELNYLDITTLGTGAASKAVVLDASSDYTWPAGQLTFQTAHSGLLFGAGASGANHALGATADNAIEFYLDGTHTTGDMRGQYLRLYFSGAGGSGEAARIFSTINNVSVATGGTVNGAHISIGTAGASAAVSGAANALRATFGIAAASTTLGGTCSVIQVDTDMDTAITVPSGFAFLRFTNTGVKVPENLFRVPNVVAVTDGLFCAHVTQTMTHSLKIISEDGTKYYVMLTNAATNRTES